MLALSRYTGGLACRVQPGEREVLNVSDGLVDQSESERRDARSRREQLEAVVREFDELGGLSLTPPQAARLFGIAPDRCERILDELVERGFLKRRGDGQYDRQPPPRE
jgi:hypothetical protein